MGPLLDLPQLGHSRSGTPRQRMTERWPSWHAQGAPYSTVLRAGARDVGLVCRGQTSFELSPAILPLLCLCVPCSLQAGTCIDMAPGAWHIQYFQNRATRTRVFASFRCHRVQQPKVMSSSCSPGVLYCLQEGGLASPFCAMLAVPKPGNKATFESSLQCSCRRPLLPCFHVGRQCSHDEVLALFPVLCVLDPPWPFDGYTTHKNCSVLGSAEYKGLGTFEMLV